MSAGTIGSLRCRSRPTGRKHSECFRVLGIDRVYCVDGRSL